MCLLAGLYCLFTYLVMNTNNKDEKLRLEVTIKKNLDLVALVAG
jgi:hypothetical protein